MGLDINPNCAEKRVFAANHSLPNFPPHTFRAGMFEIDVVLGVYILNSSKSVT